MRDHWVSGGWGDSGVEVGVVSRALGSMARADPAHSLSVFGGPWGRVWALVWVELPHKVMCSFNYWATLGQVRSLSGAGLGGKGRHRGQSGRFALTKGSLGPQSACSGPWRRQVSSVQTSSPALGPALSGLAKLVTRVARAWLLCRHRLL